MCIICAEWEKGKMTAKEAMGAIRETISVENFEHLTNLTNRIIKKEVPDLKESDAEMDEEWERKNRGGY